MFRSSEDRRSDDSGRSLERLSGRVDGLAERVDMLSRTLATTAAAIAKKDGELAVLRRELEGEHGRVEALVAERAGSHARDLRLLEERIAALASERAQTSDERRLAALDRKVAQLAERIDTLGKTVASTAAGLARRDGDLVVLGRRLNELVRHPDAGGLAESSRQRIDDLDAAVASLSMRLESEADQIAALRDGADDRAAELRDGVSTLTARLDEAERDRAALAASVAEAAATRWRELERTLGSLSERVAVIEHDGAHTAARLDRATSLWPTALRALEVRLDELVAAPRRPLPGDGVASSPPPSTPRGDVARFLEELRALEQRLESGSEAARRERDELSMRIQRLESARPPAPDAETLPIGAEVVPFRSPDS